MAEIKFLGYLAAVMGGRTKEVSLEHPRPLREILPQSFPDKDVVVLIDQKVGNLDSLVTNESFVILMPMISGG